MKSRYIDDVKVRVTLNTVVIGLHDTKEQALAHVAFIARQGRVAYIAQPGQGGKIGRTKSPREHDKQMARKAIARRDSNVMKKAA